jgi:hypothetical protein
MLGGNAVGTGKFSSETSLTLQDLILLWRSSTDWSALALSSQDCYARWLEKLERRWGAIPLPVFDHHLATDKLEEWRDNLSETPRAADALVRSARSLFKFGRDNGLLTFNRADGIAELGCAKDYTDVFWTDDELIRFREFAVGMGRQPVSDFVYFLAFTGLALTPALNLQLSAIEDHAIIKPPSTFRGRPRLKDCLPRLPEAAPFLKELQLRWRQPGVSHVLVDGNGKAWVRGTLWLGVNTVTKAANIIHVDPLTGEGRLKRLQDLKRTYALKLMKAGATDCQVASVMTWTPKAVRLLRTLGANAGTL